MVELCDLKSYDIFHPVRGFTPADYFLGPAKADRINSNKPPDSLKGSGGFLFVQARQSTVPDQRADEPELLDMPRPSYAVVLSPLLRAFTFLTTRAWVG
jgi:hypothetical protein